MNQIVEYIRNI